VLAKRQLLTRQPSSDSERGSICLFIILSTQTFGPSGDDRKWLWPISRHIIPFLRKDSGKSNMFRPIFEASTFRMGIRNVTVFHREDGKTRLRIMPLRWTLNHWVLPPVVVFYGPRISAFASPFEYPWFQIYECLYLMRLATCYIRVRFHKFEAP
jgi:hypothetical protein